MNFKVALIGNLAGGAYMMFRPIRGKGVNSHLFLARSESGISRPEWENRQFLSQNLDFLHEYGRKQYPSVGSIMKLFQFFQNQLAFLSTCFELIQFDLIQSFTGSLFLSPFWILIFGVFRKKPYIACATGSDIREVALQRGLRGQLMRYFFRRAAKTLLLNLDMVEIKTKLGLNNAEFFPFMIDTQKFRPRFVRREYAPKRKILFFMPSHLDWGVTDNVPGRSSTKGNDRFICAFARYVKENDNAHLVILDRGPDREIAKQLISQLGISSCVTFLPEMQKEELVKHFRMADVIVDQFDVGAFGTTGLEAMACAKPVMIYIKNHCADQCYSERPPVLNAQSEKEIYQQISLLHDKNYREQIGRKARSWIIKYHDADRVADRLIGIYEDVLDYWNH